MSGKIKGTPQKEKFSYEKLKADATSSDPKVRKEIIKEYYERFEEFPSYLFDNDNGIDSRLLETIRDIKNDPDTTEAMQKGITALMNRIPLLEEELASKTE